MSLGFIEKIFGKSRENLSLDDIKDYFSTAQEESSVVEFKSGDVEVIDIYKEITAFLNTEGGLLIIGAPRETKQPIGKNVVKVCVGDLTYSNFKNKDWLYQKIASNITPSPTNLKIEEFLTEDGNIFVLDISQSLNPPHQSSADGKYYIRLERDAKPAPHGIIQALFNKRRIPKLNAHVKIQKTNAFSDNVVVNITNESNVPAEKVSFIIDVYNIQGINSEHSFRAFDDVLGKKFSMSNRSDQVLVQVISVPIQFVVTHLQKDYLIFVGYWCRDLDFTCKYFTYSPAEEKIISEGTFEEGPPLLDELKKIQS